MTFIGKTNFTKTVLKPLTSNKKAEVETTDNKTEVFKTSANEMLEKITSNKSGIIFEKHYNSKDDLKAHAGDLKVGDTFSMNGRNYIIDYIDSPNGDDVFVSYSAKDHLGPGGNFVF